MKCAGYSNNNGYSTVIDSVFENDDLYDTPTASGWCQFRRTISWEFIGDIFFGAIENWNQNNRPKYKKLFINSIDGDQLSFPFSQEIMKENYRGYPLKGNKETNDLFMYVCFMTCVITGTPLGFSQSHDNDEISRALEILIKLTKPEKNLTIYDRFYLSSRLLKHYEKNKGFFIMRCKKSSTFKAVTDFVKSKKKTQTVSIRGKKYRLLKFTPHEGSEEIILITNLKKDFNNSEICELYACRWESETANRTRTTSIKLEQFRAKNINGILQEIFAALILQAASHIACNEKVNQLQFFLKKEYKKPNFKAVIVKIHENLWKIFGEIKNILKLVENLIVVTTERRIHYSRTYDRVVKSSKGNKFPQKSTVKRRKAKSK